MRYICLIYAANEPFEAMSEAARDGMINAMLDNDEELRKSGHYVDSEALEAPQAAISVKVRDSKLSTTDGPFAETKEHLGGYITIEARDLNEAVQIATRIPMARVGTIEVRPVRQLERVEIVGA